MSDSGYLEMILQMIFVADLLAIWNIGAKTRKALNGYSMAISLNLKIQFYL